MPTITATDLNNAKLDTDYIAAIATSTAATATDRLGNVKNTLAGNNATETTARALRDSTESTAKALRESTEAIALSKRGYEVPVAYAAGISLTRTSQTVSNAGAVYAPNLADLPFTTSGTFETAKFRVIQGGDASLVSYDRLSTTVKSKLDNSSLLENKSALRDFYKSLYTYSVTPATTRFAIACYGDSVASHVWGSMIPQMYGDYPNAAVMAPPIGNGLAGMTVSTTGSIVDGSLLLQDQTVLDGSGGKNDFTYLPGGDHVTLNTAATYRADLGQLTGFSEGRVYLVTGPGMGSALVELLNEAGTTLQSITVNCTGAALGATKAQFAGLDASLKYKLRTTATGVVVHLRSVFLRANGLIPLNFQRGGSTLAQNNFANQAILSYLLTDLGVSLVVCQCKEENAVVSVPATMTIFNTITASKLIVGSLPDAGPPAGQLANNAIFRNNALANNCAYFDGYYALGSYAELVRLGWQGDGVHPAAGANHCVAAQILAESGIKYFTGSKEGREVDLTGSGFPVTAGKFRIPKGDGSGTPIDILVQYGGAAPTLGSLQNIGRIAFGIPSGSTPTVQAYGSNEIGAFGYATGFIGFRAKYLVTSDATVQSDFAGGLNVNGGYLKTPAYTVATLPVANMPNGLVFVTNGRKVGELAAAGTGVMAYASNGQGWRRLSDDTAVAA